MNDDNKASSIVKFSILLIIGVALLTAVVATNVIPPLNRVSTPFSGQPHDGDTLTLDNHVFEFDNGNGVATGHIPVLIGANVDETKANLRAAISSNTDYTVG